MRGLDATAASLYMCAAVATVPAASLAVPLLQLLGKPDLSVILTPLCHTHNLCCCCLQDRLLFPDEPLEFVRCVPHPHTPRTTRSSHGLLLTPFASPLPSPGCNSRHTCCQPQRVFPSFPGAQSSPCAALLPPVCPVGPLPPHLPPPPTGTVHRPTQSRPGQHPHRHRPLLPPHQQQQQQQAAPAPTPHHLCQRTQRPQPLLLLLLLAHQTWRAHPPHRLAP